jgi:hypothetical protein
LYDRRPYFKVHMTCMSIGMMARPAAHAILSVNCSLYALSMHFSSHGACMRRSCSQVYNAGEPHATHLACSAVAAVRQGKTLNWCTPQTCKLASTFLLFSCCVNNHSALCYRQLNYMCQCIAPFDRHNKFNPASICIYGNKMFCS